VLLCVLLFGFGLVVVFGRRHAVLVLFAVFLVVIACRSTGHLFALLYSSSFYRVGFSYEASWS
jgi:NADH:ubiquinone oxidoreductase subunit K